MVFTVLNSVTDKRNLHTKLIIFEMTGYFLYRLGRKGSTEVSLVIASDVFSGE
jgi:hypothetical protein